MKNRYEESYVELRTQTDRQDREHDYIASTSSTKTTANTWFTDVDVKTFIRKKIKRFVNLKTKKDRQFKCCVTYTDCEDAITQGENSSCARMASYKDGEETHDSDLLSEDKNTK